MEKICSSCEESKPVSEFRRRKDSADGYQGACKECKKKSDSEWYSNNDDRKSYVRQHEADRRGKIQQWVREYLESHPCVDCGETDIVVLEFDHQGDKEYDVARMLKSHSLGKIKAEVLKCEVRCANDHRRKTARTLGSWRIASLV